MNFIDKALEQKLTGDDFLQAMADIYSEFKVREILDEYPAFIKDVITIIEYDYELQMEGMENIICGDIPEKYPEIITALNRSGLEAEVEILKMAKELFDTNETEYEEGYDELYGRLAINNDYDAFWDRVREYIDENLK